MAGVRPSLGRVAAPTGLQCEIEIASGDVRQRDHVPGEFVQGDGTAGEVPHDSSSGLVGFVRSVGFGQEDVELLDQQRRVLRIQALALLDEFEHLVPVQAAAAGESAAAIEREETLLRELRAKLKAAEQAIADAKR